MTFTGWAGLLGGLVALLLLDLFVVHRGDHEISARDAAWSTAGFVAISVVFGIVLGLIEGARAAEEFFAGYLLEKALSLDNVFVWAVVFSSFSVPALYQHRLLFYGVFGALLLRGGFVAAGAGLLATFEWTLYVFGVVLVWGGIRMTRRAHAPDADRNPLVRLVRRLPTTADLVGHHVIVRASSLPQDRRPARPPFMKRWYATPLLAVLVVIELTDVIFAVDSIPAIFGVTREPFIVFSATAFALLGLRSMYFLLVGMRDRFRYLDLGLALLLVFIGVKFLLKDAFHISPAASLAGISLVLGVSIVASIVASRRS